jgi:hypothetical protein
MKLALLFDVKTHREARKLGIRLIHILFRPEIKKELRSQRIGFSLLPDALFKFKEEPDETDQ